MVDGHDRPQWDGTRVPEDARHQEERRQAPRRRELEEDEGMSFKSASR
ncbi:hypothetical protein ACU635_23730 [[Actinomadura] parvosata]